jgi:hypothetical protein
MHLYFFHLNRNGTVILDPEGVFLAGPDEARRTAVLEARELIVQILKAGSPVPLSDGIEVVDENGVVLHTVTFEDVLARPSDASVP